MARPTNTDERREQITDALIEVMAQRGYDGASISAIAKAAELTPGLIHYHFGTKQEILLAAFDALVERHRTRINTVLQDSGTSASERIRGFIEAHVGLGANSDPEALACWVLMSGEALRQPKLQAQFQSAVAAWQLQLSDMIGRGVASTEFSATDPPAAATALLAAIQGYFVLAASAPNAVPPGSALPSILQMASGLLGRDFT